MDESKGRGERRGTLKESNTGGGRKGKRSEEKKVLSPPSLPPSRRTASNGVGVRNGSRVVVVDWRRRRGGLLSCKSLFAARGRRGRETQQAVKVAEGKGASFSFSLLCAFHCLFCHFERGEGDNGRRGGEERGRLINLRPSLKERQGRGENGRKGL